MFWKLFFIAASIFNIVVFFAQGHDTDKLVIAALWFYLFCYEMDGLVR